jgi:hypothetical protein
MLMRAFVSTLEVQQANIEHLLRFFHTKAMADDLRSTLPIKPGRRRDISEIKS